MDKFRSVFIACFCWLVCGISAIAADPVARIEYNRDIRPILSDKCFRCHGPDAAQRQANLRLDLREVSVAERDHQHAILPGKPDQSEIIDRIKSKQDDKRMPPVDSGSALSEREIERLRRWIEEGAEYQPHWAFLPPSRPGLPKVQNAQWPRNPLDYFVLARLEQEGLTPSVEAERTTWLRRVSLDLIGLPPTIEELDAFLADHSPQAYETVVDRLLKSPHYGERMTLDWLDGARYADTNGFFSDLERPLWRWRDWVINSFNQNQPFDQFTVEQLAGDLLPNPTLEQRIATGFHRNHMVTNESGVIDEEYRVEYVADRIETTAAVWLGLTVGCARCHDHKYDPISQKEYYQLFAFFNSGPETGLVTGIPAPVLNVPSPEYDLEKQKRKSHREQCDQAFKPFEDQLKKHRDSWEQTAVAFFEPVSRDDLAAEFQFEQNLENGVGTAATSAETPVYDQGVHGMALKIEGPHFAEFDSQLSLESDQPWTISVWINVVGTSQACILSKVEPGDDHRGFELLWQKGRLKVNLIHRRQETALQVTSRNPLSAGRWHHVAIVYDGSRNARGIKVFADGNEQELRIDHDTLEGHIANGQPWRIGRNQDGLLFSGRIDQLRLYRRCLKRAEIADSLYTAEELGGIIQTETSKRNSTDQEKLTDYLIRTHMEPAVQSRWDELRKSREAETEWTKALPVTLVMEELPQPRDTFLLNRGQYNQHGEKVEANIPAIFPTLPEGVPRNRLGLARWLVHPGHPLTARVLVNRYWMLLFGEGLVKTSNDFGSQGELPSNPDLLDWLAVEFRENGWDLKALLRQIVLSATYRQSSVLRPELLARDPENRLLARGSRFRMAGELLRDQALSVSGLLVRKIGGPSVKPYQPPGLWEAVSYDGDLTYVEDRGESLYRRSIYTYWKRQAPPPTLLSFDGPTREVCVVKRARTNTPLQALVLMNDPTYLEAARKLAEQLLQKANSDVTRIQLAFRQTTGRSPNVDETAKLLALYQQQLLAYRQEPRKARELMQVGASRSDASLDAADLAAWTTVVSVLLNLDEVVTKP